MTSTFRLLALGAILGFGALTSSGVSASAAPLPQFPPAMGQVSTVNGGIIQVAQSNRMRSNWDEKRDGRRCSSRNDNCRHFHDGFYYATPWWSLPLIVGGSFGNNNYGNGYDRLSCGEARAMVRHRGYNNVATIECNGRTYTFKARRGDHRVTVFVNSHTGAVWRG